MAKDTHIEDMLALQLSAAGIDYEREFRAMSERRFKWDFRIADLLVEVQGAIWVRGGHSTGTGITRDCEKLNLATIAGWRTLQVTKDHVKSGQAFAWIREALGGP